MNFKEGWKKFWHLLWKDQSLKGWIFAFVFLFVFIKLLFFPVLNFATGTTYPTAIVESCSMYHDIDFIFFHDFNTWWNKNSKKYEKYNITKEDFKNFKLKNGFSKGDILAAGKPKPEELKIGDIIIFNANQKNPLIHRIVKIRQENGKYIFSTLGDNNPYSFEINNNPYLIDEVNIKEEQLVAKVSFKIAPHLGWGKLIFYDWRKPELERGLCGKN